MKKRTAFVLAALLLLTCAAPAALAADTEPAAPWILSTDGTPVCCGAVAVSFQEELASNGQNGWPVLTDTDGNALPAGQLAVTGNRIVCTTDSETVTRTLVLLGDVAGSGRFNIAQLVIMARLLTQHGGTELQELAADLNGSGAIDIADLVIMAGFVRDGREPGPEVPYPQPGQELSGRTLVACYSATGTTRRIAEMIAQTTGGDLMELVPLQPYTAADLQYGDPSSRVSREHADPALRDVPLVQAAVDDFAAYDTVFIGYPIWWGIAAWPVNKFLTANDFTGKNVWCFCTSGSSGVGQSAVLLEQLAGTGNWLGAYRFSGGTGQAEVDAWLDTMREEAA